MIILLPVQSLFENISLLVGIIHYLLNHRIIQRSAIFSIFALDLLNLTKIPLFEVEIQICLQDYIFTSSTKV